MYTHIQICIYACLWVFSLNLKQSLTEKLQVSCSETVREVFAVQTGSLAVHHFGLYPVLCTPRPMNILIPWALFCFSSSSSYFWSGELQPHPVRPSWNGLFAESSLLYPRQNHSLFLCQAAHTVCSLVSLALSAATLPCWTVSLSKQGLYFFSFLKPQHRAESH